jgi:hypothetical protein
MGMLNREAPTTLWAGKPAIWSDECSLTAEHRIRVEMDNGAGHAAHARSANQPRGADKVGGQAQLVPSPMHVDHVSLSRFPNRDALATKNRHEKLTARVNQSC